MKLKEGEEILKEYFFSKSKDSFSKGILTNRRLVFITNSSEENYPLSKVTSVKTENEVSGFRSKVLGFSVIILIILLIITGVIIFGESHIKLDEAIFLTPVYLILIFLIRFGLRPDKVTTNFVITQMGGIKKYTAVNNKNLQEFIEKINETLI